MFTLTRKEQRNGRVFRGIAYTVTITDVDHAATFFPKAEADKLGYDNLVAVENRLGSHFHYNREKDSYWQNPNFGTADNFAEQTANLKDFIDKCIGLSVKYGVAEMQYLI